MNANKVIKDRYELHEPLGSGAMGDVFRGRDMQTDQSVAVKALKADLLAHDPDMLTRFVREGEALRQLNHPNIVKLLDVAQHHDTHYLVMEYVPGGDLRKLLAEYPDGLPLPRALAIGLDLADALTRAHRLNIIHRDLKPANVLVAEDGTPRLSDFGIARFGDTSAITASGAVVGTFAYLSPEACMSLTLDERADIWSFGIVLYEMLSGHRPFEGTSPGAMMMATMRDPVPDLQMVRPEISDPLNDLLYRMLEKNRDARIPSVRLVGAELEAIIKGSSTTPSPVVRQAVVTSDPSVFATPTPNLTVRPNNLPAQTTPFVGREHELAELSGLLKNPQVRLVTILAPGGMGKTRLSLEAAEQLLKSVSVGTQREGLRPSPTEFSNGVFFAALAPLTAPENIIPAVAEAVNFQFYPGGEPKQQLLDFFREKHILLVMDNFEHVVAGAELVSAILASAPGVKVLATSRERLNLSGETIFNLEGMDFPDWETPEDALEFSAVKLFMQSAKRVRPDFELEAKDLKYVARICRLVEGLPLGILLAAAWVEMLVLDEIAAEIEKSLDFLESEGRDVPTRQRSIRAVFDYSWNLLTEEERAVFAKLSVFRGGFTREATQTVAGANLRVLMALVNKSLLRRDASSGRYEVHELLRQYAQQQLEHSGEADATRDAHSNFYADFLAQREPLMMSPTQKQVIGEISSEMENILSAWDWAVEHHYFDSINKSIHPLLGMAENLGQFGENKERFREAAAHLSPAATDQQSRLIVARLRLVYGYVAGRIGEFDMMRSTAEEGMTLFRQMNSKRDIEAALGNLAIAAGAQGRYEEAGRYSAEKLALARELDDKPNIYFTISGMAWGLFTIGRYQEARQMFEQEMSAVDAFGVPIIMASFRQELGEVYHALREDEAAKKLLEEALVISKDLDNRRMTAYIFTSLGNVAHSSGKYEEAQHYFEESLIVHREMGDRIGIAEALNALGGGFWSLGEYLQAKQCHQEALTIYREIGDIRGIANSLALLATAGGTLGEFAETRTYLEECLALRRQMGHPADIVDALAHFNRLENFAGDYEAALRWSEEVFKFHDQAASIPAFWGHYSGNLVDTLVRMGDYQKAKETVENLASRLPWESAPKFFQAIGRNRLGWANRELGNLVEAEQDLRESLRLATEMHSPLWQIASIIQLGALFEMQGNLHRAVELLSFAREFRYTPYSDKQLVNKYLEPLKAALPADEFAAAVERGKALDLDTVVQQILDEDA